tara:strand:+ start:2422 stop:4824 length:2403 start_codon:yes stop_codon:yes gene_type:complete
MTEPNKDIVTDENKAVQARRLQEQCFLVYNFEAFAQSNNESSFSNFVPLHGNPMQIVQRLLAIPDLNALMTLKPYLLSALMPQIRLYKVHYPSRDSQGIAVEIPFDDYLNPSSIEDMTKSGYSKGLGAGVKSFEWELLGTNPAESDNNIKAKLKLHFNSMQDLLAPRGNHDGQKISFINLIEPSAKFKNDSGEDGKGASEGTRSYNEKYFRIRASVGYGDPVGQLWDNEPEVAGLKEVIKNARQFFNLNMVTHSLEFKEHGAVELEIEYIADSEGALSSKYADVLLIGRTEAMDQAEAARAAERENAAAKVSSENDANCGKEGDDRETEAADDEKELLEGQAEAEAEDRAILYNTLLSALENSGGIYKVRVNAKDLGMLDGEQAQGDTAAARRTSIDKAWVTSNRKVAEGGSLSDLRDATDEAIDDPNEAAKSFSDDGDASPGPDELDIHYFHYGDLLNVALRCLYETGTPELERLKVITGPYVYYDPQTKRLTDTYNMCDIPISLNLFQIWFMDKVVKPQVKKYSLKRFIKDSVTSLVGAAMRPECFGKEYGKAPANLSLQMLQVPATDDGKCRVSGVSTQGKIGGKRVRSLENILPYPSAVKAEKAESFPYLFIYVSSHGAKGFGPPAASEGSREERDAKLGTYHFRIGADGGLVKKINFKKSDQPYAREARMETEGELGGGFLREKYNAEVEMFGNAIFRPGMHVYIDPASVGAGDPTQIKSIARMLGLGGYFLTTNVKCSIEAGKFQTDLKCVWTSSGSGNVADDTSDEGSECQDGASGSQPPGTTGDMPVGEAPA